MDLDSPIRILVTGGREYDDHHHVFAILDHTKEKLNGNFIIIQGGASGVDNYALDWATMHGIPVITEKADWEKHGKAAGPIRNQAMIDKHEPDLVLAFPGGKGTDDMIKRAIKARIIVYRPPK